MTATASSVRQVGDTHGNQQMTVTDVTFDASYPTGGLSVTAAQLGLRNIQHAVANITTTAAAGAAVEVVPLVQVGGATVLLKANAAAAEVPNATNLATLVVRVTAWGY